MSKIENRIQDKVNYKVSSIRDASKFKDFATNGTNKEGIIVQIAGTHSGLIVRNKRLYLPDRMRAGASSWTKPYNKPVLVHHDEEKDPIGRVIDAQYIDTSSSISNVLKDRYKIKDHYLSILESDRISIKDKLKTLRAMNGILTDREYSGLGYLRLTLHIPDAEAAKKFKTGIYLTGSSGASTDQVLCSVCGTDWLQDGKCEHDQGEVYDGVLCYLVAGSLLYDEFSLVNRPSDAFASVQSLSDSYVPMIFYELNTEEVQMTVKNAALQDGVETPTELTVEQRYELYKQLKLEHISLEDYALLANSSFCDKQQVYPVLDETHYRVIKTTFTEKPEFTEMSDALARKAEAYGYTDEVQEVTEKPAEVKDKNSEVESLLKQLNDAIAAVELEETSELSEENKTGLKAVVTKLTTYVGKDSVIQALKLPSEEAVQREARANSKLEELLVAKNREIATLKKEISDSYEDLKLANDKLVDKATALKSQKISQLIQLYSLSGELKDSLKDELNTYSDELLDKNLETLSQKVDIEKISAKLNDGLARKPEEKVENPTISDPAPVANKVNYKVQEWVDSVYRHILLQEKDPEKAQKFYAEQVGLGNAKPEEKR